ncbi:MAG: CHAT domain-containing protein [Ilumatobacter sp.]|nr:CHAT domain-containing protein [Ilumatobacter sp.]
MDDCADLQITVGPGEPGSYEIEMRSAMPESETVSVLGRGDGCVAAIRAEELAAIDDIEQYGRLLTQSLFTDESVRTEYAKARSEAEAMRRPLRIRLVVEAPELHDVRWETLFDPDDADTRLALSTRLRLSRYLSSRDRERVVPRRRSELRALIAVANRRDLGPVNVRAEVQRAVKGLGTIEADVLPEEVDGSMSRATLATIRERLRDGEHDILYVVAHGGIRGDQARIWLDQEPGDEHDSVTAERFADVIRQLPVRPRLIVLGSCESAGTGTEGAVAALGPRLAAAGIPAVLAMQGEMEVASLDRFMKVFFEQLADDGVIDRAVAEARNEIWNQSDWWAPALFMRLTTGRIWSAGFGNDPTVLRDLRNLRDNTAIKECTPVLGPRLMEPVLGSRLQTSRALAAEFRYPLGPGDVDHLYRVDQYIATIHRQNHVRVARRAVVRKHLLEEHAPSVPEALRDVDPWNDAQVTEAIASVTDRYLAATPDGPYRRLARLRLPIYVETSTHDALERALVLEGAAPQVRMCPWYANEPDLETHLFDATPTPEEPLVYHFFGRSSVPESTPVGDDGVYDYLLGLGRSLEHVPNDVSGALIGKTSLMLLGFQLDDPEFRTVFRYIMTRPGVADLRRRGHAAVQIEPTDDLVTDVGLAVNYYERYFTERGLTPYWGNADEFMSEVWEWIDTQG